MVETSCRCMQKASRESHRHLPDQCVNHLGKSKMSFPKICTFWVQSSVGWCTSFTTPLNFICGVSQPQTPENSVQWFLCYVFKTHHFKFFGQTLLSGRAKSPFSGRKIFEDCTWIFFVFWQWPKVTSTNTEVTKKYEKLRVFLVGMQEVFIFSKLAAPRAGFHPPGLPVTGITRRGSADIPDKSLYRYRARQSCPVLRHPWCPDPRRSGPICWGAAGRARRHRVIPCENPPSNKTFLSSPCTNVLNQSSNQSIYRVMFNKTEAIFSSFFLFFMLFLWSFIHCVEIFAKSWKIFCNGSVAERSLRVDVSGESRVTVSSNVALRTVVQLATAGEIEELELHPGGIPGDLTWEKASHV